MRVARPRPAVPTHMPHPTHAQSWCPRLLGIRAAKPMSPTTTIPPRYVMTRGGSSGLLGVGGLSVLSFLLGSVWPDGPLDVLVWPRASPLIIIAPNSARTTQPCVFFIAGMVPDR